MVGPRAPRAPLDRAGSPPRFVDLEGAPRAPRATRTCGNMKRILGMGVGLVYFGIAYGAFSRASAGWAADQSDVGFWWSVITVFLTVAALSALIGTWIHTQQSRG